jgi:hypothetical protein
MAVVTTAKRRTRAEWKQVVIDCFSSLRQDGNNDLPCFRATEVIPIVVTIIQLYIEYLKSLQGR